MGKGDIDDINLMPQERQMIGKEMDVSLHRPSPGRADR
jgi:hypothetical protein